MSQNRWRQAAGARRQGYGGPVDQFEEMRGDQNARRWRASEEQRASAECMQGRARGSGRQGKLPDWSRSSESRNVSSRGPYPGASQPRHDHGSVKVTITTMAGAILLGPEDMSCSLVVASLKDRLRKARPGTGVRILHGTQELQNHEDLVGIADSGMGISSEVSLSLTAVLTKTYSIVAWGDKTYGGSAPSAVADGVMELVSSSGAFAAILEDGAVVAWGHPAYGGDVGQAASQLRGDVTSIVAGQNAFVALKKSGAAVAWGNARMGGRMSAATAKKLSSGVVSLQSSGEAFAALKENGEVVTWGQDGQSNSTAVSQQLQQDVAKLHSTRGAFAALKKDGSVVTWGSPHGGGNSAAVRDQLTSGVLQIFNNATSFVALKEGGMIVAWGNASCGGQLGTSAEQLSSGVIAIHSIPAGKVSSGSAFAALKEDGSIVTWGQPGEQSIAAEVVARGGVVCKNSGALAMVLESGELVTSGDARSGGDCSTVVSQLHQGVKAIASTSGAFAALNEDGSVVSWGRGELANDGKHMQRTCNLGGDFTAVASSLKTGILAVYGTQSAFAVIKDIKK